MPRATSVIAADHNQSSADAVILDSAQRSAAKGTATTVKGVIIEIDLDGPIRLRTGDLLVLDDNSLVEVVAAPEPLIEARAANVSALARLAWHLGDRHIQAELLPNRIRARRDPAAEALLTSLGAKVIMIEAPFQPEGGAYSPAPVQEHAHDHVHDHAHDHDHAHGHKHK